MLCYYKVSFSLHFVIKVVYVKNHKQMLLVSHKAVWGHRTALVNHLVAASLHNRNQRSGYRVMIWKKNSFCMTTTITWMRIDGRHIKGKYNLRIISTFRFAIKFCHLIHFKVHRMFCLPIRLSISLKSLVITRNKF